MPVSRVTSHRLWLGQQWILPVFTVFTSFASVSLIFYILLVILCLSHSRSMARSLSVTIPAHAQSTQPKPNDHIINLSHLIFDQHFPLVILGIVFLFFFFSVFLLRSNWIFVVAVVVVCHTWARGHNQELIIGHVICSLIIIIFIEYVEFTYLPHEKQKTN